MERTLDARGLHCPLPLVKARAALAALAPGDVLVVLATDPEAPIDLAALAADGGHALQTVRESAHWRLVLTKAADPASPPAHGEAGRELPPAY
jgi:tRNA 2-thiouridine synthesizing protein A